MHLCIFLPWILLSTFFTQYLESLILLFMAAWAASTVWSLAWPIALPVSSMYWPKCEIMIWILLVRWTPRILFMLSHFSSKSEQNIENWKTPHIVLLNYLLLYLFEAWWWLSFLSHEHGYDPTGSKRCWAGTSNLSVLKQPPGHGVPCKWGSPCKFKLVLNQ